VGGGRNVWDGRSTGGASGVSVGGASGSSGKASSSSSSTSGSSNSGSNKSSSGSSGSGRGVRNVWPTGWVAQRYVLIELVLLHGLQRGRSTLPRPMRALCGRLISGHPLHDVSLLLWVGMPVAIWFMGWPLTWMLIVNIALSLVLSGLVPAPVPSQFDATLRPKGRVSPTGFPCLELHLGVVIIAMLAFSRATVPLPVTYTATALVAVLICTRLYALSHFLLQLLGAWRRPLFAHARTSSSGCHKHTHTLFPRLQEAWRWAR